MKLNISLDSGLRDSASHLYELECLRGLAILLVYLFHVYGMSTGNMSVTTNPLMAYMVSGNTGVTLFFVLSGFLLSLPWLKYGAGHTATLPGIARFYKARALRILPLYFLAVLFAIIATGNYESGLKAALFTFVGFDMFPYSVVWWTLSTEVQFYLLLPLIFWAWFAGNVYRTALIMALALWLYFYTTNVIASPLIGKDHFFLTKSIFARLPAFLAGIAAAIVFTRYRNSALTSRELLQSRLASTVLALAALFLLGKVLQHAAFLGDWEAERSWHIHHSFEALLWSVFLLLLLFCKPLGAVLLINRPLAIVGKLSYSMYLNHVPILFYLIYFAQTSLGKEAYINSWWYYFCPVLALVLSLVCSYLTYKWVELPFLNAKRRIPTGAQATVETQ